MKENTKNSKRRSAKVVGTSLLLMAVVAAFSAPALSKFYIFGNAAQTGANVAGDFGKYSASVVGWVGILILDFIVALHICNYNRKANYGLAIITGILRLIYTAFLGAAIIQLLTIQRSTPATETYSAISSFNSIWGWGLIVFGLHLIALGILFKYESGKKWVNTTIRALLFIAGLGYMILYIGIIVVANPLGFMAKVQPLFLVPMIFGEIFYAIWMLAKGGKTDRVAEAQAMKS